MITLRKSEERGHFDRGWLDTCHTFSFADYHDPAHMGFRTLRVINEDRVKPREGFGAHSHRDMEIITLVLEGTIQHKDGLGNVAIIMPGDVQRMSAGTGVTHSEYNPSRQEPAHFLQIWILPEKTGLPPGYEQKTFSSDDKWGNLRLIASRNGTGGSVTIHQDVKLYTSLLAASQNIGYVVPVTRHAWFQLVRGEVLLNGLGLRAGDGAAISDETTLKIRANRASEFLLFDLP